MDNTEKKLEILDFVVLFGLIIAGCLAGKFVMSRVLDTILGFNGPAIGVLVCGEIIWMKVRKHLQEQRNKIERNN
jgi:uncharacterized membrane protein YciS (DUF1049 family)